MTKGKDMETKLKVGDKVRIIDISLNQSTGDLFGKITTVSKVRGLTSIDLEGSYYAWESWQLEKVVDAKKYPPAQGKFVMEDGTPGTVNIFVFGNVTQVTIVVGEPPYRKLRDEMERQFFAGLAFCNPKDTFDLNTGIRVACREALIGGTGTYHPHGTKEYRYSVYSSIRKAMRESNKKGG
jgi:hypothetical protein